MNTALFSKKDIRETMVNMVPKQRTESFFFLGMSISKITTYIVGLQAVRAFSQLIEEWEYFNAGKYSIDSCMVCHYLIFMVHNYTHFRFRVFMDSANVCTYTSIFLVLYVCKYYNKLEFKSTDRIFRGYHAKRKVCDGEEFQLHLPAHHSYRGIHRLATPQYIQVQQLRGV